jgi:GT2 family glycosyltransferase
MNIALQTTTATVSIIIPFHNNVELTKQCIQSIFECTSSKIPYEIVLVDDASTDLFSFETNYTSFRLIKNETNLGFAPSCNYGARCANSKYLVFLNNDTLALEGWLDGLIDPIETNSQIGIVGSKLLYPDNTIQHAGIAVDDERMPFHIYHRFPATFPGVNKLREYQAVTGACFIIKKELFQSVGGFDERYQNGFEDMDLCFRVGQAGYKIFYSPQSCLYHLESKTVKMGPSHYGDNLTLFNEKWHDELITDFLNYFKADLAVDAELPIQLQRLKASFQDGEKVPIAIWGAGGAGRHMAVMLRLIGITPDFFVDSDSKKWGTLCEEVKICNPNYLQDMKQKGQSVFVIIASLYFNEIQMSLRNFGFEPGQEFW